jgi:membrane-bound ClpP family serine protease
MEALMRIFLPLVGVAILFRDIHPAIAVVCGLVAIIVFASARDISASGRYSLLLFAVGVGVLAANRIIPFAGAMPAGLLCVALSGIRLNAAEAALSPPVEVEVAPVAPAPQVQVQVQAQVETRVQTQAPPAPRRVAQKSRLRTKEMIEALYE